MFQVFKIDTFSITKKTRINLGKIIILQMNNIETPRNFNIKRL